MGWWWEERVVVGEAWYVSLGLVWFEIGMNGE